MGDLDGVRLKIARAGEHMKEFGHIAEALSHRNPYSIDSEIDPQTGDQVFKITDEPAQPPPIPALGDILFNFRSALDHLAWQLVLKANETPGKHTEFPIFNDPAVWKSDSPRRMRGMNQAMKDMLREEQPCFGPNPHRNLALWSLHEYGNIDKHRLLIITESGMAGVFWSPTGPCLFIHEGPVHKDTVIARFPASHMKDQISVVPEIAFGEPPAFEKHVRGILIAIEMNVTRIVDRFEETFF